MKKSIYSYMEQQADTEEKLFDYFNKRVNEIQEEMKHTPFFMISKKNKLKEELEFFRQYEEKHFKNYIDTCNKLYEKD